MCNTSSVSCDLVSKITVFQKITLWVCYNEEKSGNSDVQTESESVIKLDSSHLINPLSYVNMFLLFISNCQEK